MFPQRLQEALNLKNLKAADLAHLSGIDASQISRYLKDEREPKAETITTLAQALGVSADFLLGISDDPTPEIGESNLNDYEREVISLWRQGQRNKAATIILTSE